LAGLLNILNADKLFFSLFLKFFLNGQAGLFVSADSRLIEGAKGWQAFFSLFLKFFERLKGSVFAWQQQSANGGPQNFSRERVS
jgi:hypothetical protein